MKEKPISYYFLQFPCLYKWSYITKFRMCI